MGTESWPFHGFEDPFSINSAGLYSRQYNLRGVPCAQIVRLGLGSGSLLKPDLTFDGPWGKLAVFPGTKQTRSSPAIEHLSLPGRPVLAIPSPGRSLSRPNSGENTRSKLNYPTKLHECVETSRSYEDIGNCIVSIPHFSSFICLYHCACRNVTQYPAFVSKFELYYDTIRFMFCGFLCQSPPG